MPRLFSAFGTAFVAIGFICAPLAALVTFVLYDFIGPTRGQPLPGIGVGVLIGVGMAVAVWWAFEQQYRDAAIVNPRQYRNLQVRLRSDENQLDSSPPIAQPLADAAGRDAIALRDDLQRLLSQPQSGAKWLSAEGYLEAWSDMYRLEEALVFLLPVEEVLAMANDDLSRLEGSNLPNAEAIKLRLTNDIKALTPAVVSVGAPAQPAGRSSEFAIRADLADIRRSINRYREDQWNGLVAERNRTMLAAAIAGFFANFGLVSVIVWNIDPKALEVATSFIVTGALISLLHQATLVGSSESGIEDFGQSTARLFSATFVSGLIALLGVIVLEGAGLVTNGASIIPSHLHWKETFDWTQNRGGYFVAALFGFAPSLLFQILQSRADTIKSNLDTSQVTGAKTKK